MLYLYAIIDKPGVEFELPRGLEDAELEVLPFDGLGAVAGPLSGRPSADAANAHRHMAVLKTLMQECTVLPTRFGAVFRKREQLHRAVAGLHTTLAADLERLRGQVEVALKVVDRQALILAPVRDDGTAAVRVAKMAEPASNSTPKAEIAPATEAVPASDAAGELVPAADPAPTTEASPAPIYDAEPAMGPGLRYITSRRAESDRRAQANTALANEVIEHFAPLIADKKWRALPSNSGRPVISMAVLLPRDQLETFQAALEELRRARPKLDIVSTGPWPPYSFVKDGGNAFAERSASGEVPGRIAS